MSVKLTLWKIEAELAELVDTRAEMAEADADLTAIDGQIAEYVAREIAKVDGIRGFFKHAEMMLAAAKAEQEAQRKRARFWETQIERLKESCRAVMESMTWPAGRSRRLNGQTGYLMLKQNGGRPAVVINKPELLPESLVRYEGSISGQNFQDLQRIVNNRTWFNDWLGRTHVRLERIPNIAAISAALDATCPLCRGVQEGDQCPDCDGDGKARVPGAHFDQRGSHVEVK